MADSIRKRILLVVASRVAAITTENGFNTDAGRSVYIGGMPTLGPSDPDAVIAVIPQSQNAGLTQMHVAGEWPIDIVAVANASAQRDDHALLVEDVLADIQRAIELEDRTLGGLIGARDFSVGDTKPYDREPASDVVAVAQTYSFSVQRVFGSPDVRR
jgi:hypothetical protein